MLQPEAYNPLEYGAITDSISRQFFSTDPVPLAEVTSFEGSGIYALFYTGRFPAYARLAAENRRVPGSLPIYIGKAAPSRRKGDQSVMDLAANVYEGTGLFTRIKNHRASIEAAKNLDVSDFTVRLLVLAYIWVPMAETAMINRFLPLWNNVVDGFGNHNPGKGRINGVRPRWDTLHPGREWADRYPERDETAEDIAQDVVDHLNRLYH